MEWQPIESAPHETIVLVITDKYEHPITAFCQWYDDAAVMDFDRDFALAWFAVPGLMGDNPIKVTHWMPLPEPPK